MDSAASGTSNGMTAGGMVPPGPPAEPTIPTPLPPNWSEHKAPNGTLYYYNNLTKQSTYTRPLPTGIAPSFPPPLTSFPPSSIPPTLFPSPFTQQPHLTAPSTTAPPPKKKEKPKEKILIPGTTWTKVVTTSNNVFYTEKASKRSSWTIPDEIKDAVESYEQEVRLAKLRVEEEERVKKEEARLEEIKQRERIRMEIEEERKNKVDLEKRQKKEADKERERKRKERDGEDEPIEGEEEEDAGRPSKQIKLDDAGDDDEAVDQGSNTGAARVIDPEDEDEAAMGPMDEEDEEAWQAAVAAEIARETAIKDKQKKENKAARKAQEQEAKIAVFQAPVQVDLNPDEGKALFKSLLYEKDISPFAPWEISLPLFINDPRYVLLPSEKLRQEVYEDYCREVARNRRLGKSKPVGAASETTTSSSTTKDPLKEYKALLRAEVKSTRTIWDDFRRSWKKDRRFFDFGKDDRQREKVFREHLRELGERKRADAQRAEKDFFELLSEHDEIRPDSEWARVKQSMTSDPRYDAVGSSSLRAELFQRHVKNIETQGESSNTETPEQAAARKAKERKEKAQASLRDRQQQVQGEKMRLERDLQKSKYGAGKEDGEREFGSLLIQAIREHNVAWNDAIPQLEKDDRWNHPALTLADKHDMFIAHLQSLAHKRLDALHKVFLAHAPALDTPFEDVFPEIVNEFAVTRLNLTPEKLESRYEEWQKVRFQQSKAEFQALLKESSFVDFWGRLKNKALANQGVIPGADDDDEEDDADEAGGKANLETMAKQIDLKEMHDVLQHDKRYLVFDHVPDQREEWLREYLGGLDNALANLHIPAMHTT